MMAKKQESHRKRTARQWNSEGLRKQIPQQTRVSWWIGSAQPAQRSEFTTALNQRLATKTPTSLAAYANADGKP